MRTRLRDCACAGPPHDCARPPCPYAHQHARTGHHAGAGAPGTGAPRLAGRAKPKHPAQRVLRRPPRGMFDRTSDDRRERPQRAPTVTASSGQLPSHASARGQRGWDSPPILVSPLSRTPTLVCAPSLGRRKRWWLRPLLVTRARSITTGCSRSSSHSRSVMPGRW